MDHIFRKDHIFWQDSWLVNFLLWQKYVQEKGKELPKTRQKQISMIYIYGDDKKHDWFWRVQLNLQYILIYPLW